MFVDLSRNKLDKSVDIEAINNQIQNILSSELYSNEGVPWFGIGINLLFEQINPSTDIILKNNLHTVFDKWITRATLIDVNVVDNNDYNEIIVKITYKVKKTNSLEEFSYIRKV